MSSVTGNSRQQPHDAGRPNEPAAKPSTAAFDNAPLNRRVHVPEFDGEPWPFDAAQRLYAQAAAMLTPHKRALFGRLIEYRTRHVTVVLEDINQPHNASACLRSCDCFGVQDVHVVENYNAFRPNVDIALGATQWLTLHRYGAPQQSSSRASSRGRRKRGASESSARPPQPEDDRPGTRACCEKLRAAGYRIVITVPADDAVPLEELDVAPKTALLFGTEVTGISDDARRLADAAVTIPMFGFTESFNISVAVALSLHHLIWKLHNARDIAWQLPPHEKLEVQLAWAHAVLRKSWPGVLSRFRETSRQSEARE